MIGREVCLVEEPQLRGATKPVVLPGLKGLVFSSACLNAGLSDLLGDVELDVYRFGVRRLSSDGLAIGRERVGGDSTCPLLLLSDERLHKGFERTPVRIPERRQGRGGLRERQGR